jgi:D-ribose pyranase
MRETGTINRDIDNLLSQLGHTDEIVVCDAGFAISSAVATVDISLAKNKPAVPEVLQELIRHFSVEKLVMAKETKAVSPTRFRAIVDLFDEGMPVETIPQTESRQGARTVKGIIRTGDFTAYSNVLLISGAGDRWYVEQPGGKTTRTRKN